jgi:hypothetical protein
MHSLLRTKSHAYKKATPLREAQVSLFNAQDLKLRW